MNKNKGFTLIELLVVIAIIGILASLVLVALGNARDKAADARIKSNISQLRTLAESVYDNNGSSYATVADCFGEGGDAADCGGANTLTSVTSLRGDIADAGSTLTATVSEGGDDYCVAATLVSDSSSQFCADSSGITQQGNFTCTAGACTAGS